MNTLNTICTALTAVFGVFLLLLAAEIAFVLFRRKIFWSPQLATESSGGDSLNRKPTKELFYFFCWKNPTARIEPDAETAETPAEAPPSVAPPSPADSELDELMKQHALYGPSRVLFTIREEEREEMEAAESRCSSVSKKSRCVSLDEVAVTVTVDPVVIEFDDSTPFTTPCASPPFYTPSPSPPRSCR